MNESDTSIEESDSFAVAGRLLPMLLSTWQDSDVAHYYLGSVLGMFPNTPFNLVKGVVSTVNPKGTAIQRAADALVRAEILEYRNEPDGPQYRWRSDDSLVRAAEA